ncbi:hypothetical protein [Saccharopolyspora hattusasensis]|uniref:hypothetical protein n=1 Tax=Saccharopolyspora hattusasensis TaxID=1128679 RepID=UPI003D966193
MHRHDRSHDEREPGRRNVAVALTFTGNIGTISALLSAAANTPLLVQVLPVLVFAVIAGFLACGVGRARNRCHGCHPRRRDELPDE